MIQDHTTMDLTVAALCRFSPTLAARSTTSWISEVWKRQAWHWSTFLVRISAISAVAATWTLKPLGPSHRKQGGPTMFFCAVARKKFRQTEPFLKLKHVAGHDGLLLNVHVWSTMQWLTGQKASDHEKNPRLNYSGNQIFKSECLAAGFHALFHRITHTTNSTLASHVRWPKISA